nr:antibiotic biosynthesis monooxygenase [Candidatus Sigynarchaeota archaeon]
MTHTIIASLPIKEIEIDNAIALMKKHAEWVRQNEPHTLHYNVYKVKGRNVIVVYEQYESTDAFKEHGKNLGARAGNLASCLGGKPEIIELEDV